MLEPSTLLLRPWIRTSATAPSSPGRLGPGATREVVNVSTGKSIGVVRWQVAPGLAGLSWLSGPILAAHEIEDDPLVFIVRKSWAFSPRWEVQDADGHPVATVRGDWVLDIFDQCLARITRRPGEEGFRFCAQDGREMARVTQSGNDLQISFAAEVQGEPFIKMALLGAVLCRK